MYPYFQKSSFLHAAENTADPIRSFLTRNPGFGTLVFQVTGGQGAFPVPDATINITHSPDERLGIAITVRTDESGKTEPLSLPDVRKCQRKWRFRQMRTLSFFGKIESA